MGRLMQEYATSLRRKDTTPAELSVDSSFFSRDGEILSNKWNFLRASNKILLNSYMLALEIVNLVFEFFISFKGKFYVVSLNTSE